MSINIFQRRRSIAAMVTQSGHQTLNQMAQTLGISLSSVWRHQTARQALADTPVRAFWSSAPGMDYLIRVVVAVFYCFGIKQGVGAERLSEFFRLIRLDSHVATSPSALRAFKTRLVESIEQYEAQQRETLSRPPDKTVMVGGDETFFEVPILVLMELASGYLLFETAKPTRSFESWSEEVDGVEWPDGWRIRAMVSDGAKALVKLAVERLQCVHLPDVFHLLRDLGQPWVRALGREHKRLEREANTLTKRQDKQRSAQQQAVYESQVQLYQVQAATLAQAQTDYQQAMNTITTALHPFNLHTGEGQHWDELERQLRDPLQQLETLAQRLDLCQGHQTIEAFRAHLPSLAQGINLWWHGMLEDLAIKTHDPSMHSWVLSAGLLATTDPKDPHSSAQSPLSTSRPTSHAYPEYPSGLGCTDP